MSRNRWFKKNFQPLGFRSPRWFINKFVSKLRRKDQLPQEETPPWSEEPKK